MPVVFRGDYMRVRPNYFLKERPINLISQRISTTIPTMARIIINNDGRSIPIYFLGFGFTSFFSVAALLSDTFIVL